MPSQYAHLTSPPRNRSRDHSPTKSSPLRHTYSTLSNGSDSSVPSRQATVSSNASSNHSQQSSVLSSYGSAADSYSGRPSAKRERSESPVKKNAAFAQWEAREQLSQGDAPGARHPPPSRNADMNVSPKKVKDDAWRSNIGRSETRSALNSLPPNAMPEPPTQRPLQSYNDQPSRSSNHEDLEWSQAKPSSHGHARAYSADTGYSSPESVAFKTPSNAASRNSLATLSRSDSMRASTRPRPTGHARFSSVDNSGPHLDEEDLAKLQHSSTPQLRHLSKLASDSTDDLTVHSPEEQVAGLAGRRRLQRSNSVRPSPQQQTQSAFGSQWQSTKWMDSQRKHIQAYEYLCHIGEARAWLEDVLEPAKLPPIVQLEEALRDGVTLAEVVNSLSSRLTYDQQRSLGSLRIFRSPKLQFRHSDNIALFFRFLANVELPELFRFELVDLYEKKNIPKVIYCLHALSWLLYRRGITSFTISHLVGQLEFTGEELEETQKGIDRSGVKMPDFGGMRKELDIPEPPPPPDPTPEELLAEHEPLVEDLQSQVRGMIVRTRLGNVMQDLWDGEQGVALLQAHIRAGFAREVFDFRYVTDLSTRRFQAAATAMLVRKAMRQRQQSWGSAQGKRSVVKVQSFWRGKQQRAETKHIKSQLQAHRHGLKDFQAAVRGALGRWRAGDTWQETHSEHTEAMVCDLQAAARGAAQRIRVGAIMNQLWDVEDSVNLLQATMRGARIRQKLSGQRLQAREAAADVVRIQTAVRGLIERRRQQHQHGERKFHEQAIVGLQTLARGLLSRIEHARINGALHGSEDSVVKAQTLARARHCRMRVAATREALSMCSESSLQLQSLGRGLIVRRRIGGQLGALEDQEERITTAQSVARAFLVRQKVFEQLVGMEKEEQAITELQGLARAMVTRSKIGRDLSELESEEEMILELQNAARAFMVRGKFEEKKKHYKQNMQKVIKLQSFVRAKQQGKSYESLMKGANPPLPVVRRHLHLLTDAHLEFEGEIEAERLRRLVVERVHEVEQVEGYVEGLDVKVGLLVKNKISLDEVVKHQKHYGGSASQLLRTGSGLRQAANGVDLKGLNKSSRKKLSGYEELFFHLQTQPAYLARLFYQLSNKGIAEKESKNTERLILTLFSYAHKSREEYFFLRLLAAATQHLVSASRDLEDFLRLQNGSLSQRLFLGNVRSPIHRSYLKQLLGGMVKEGICGHEHLDLESDPLQIHLALINDEELSTGRPSNRQRELPREVIIRDHEVRRRYVKHLSDLRDLCDTFLLSLEETLHRVPYGVRYLASSQYEALQQQHPHDDPGHLALTVGSWLWKSYLLPAFREPEMWGVIDRGLSPGHKRNLAQVTSVLGQVCAAGRLFGQDNLYLQPLNSWVTEGLGRWQDSLHNLFSIESPEEHFDADQFSDLHSRIKPTVYMQLSDIFQIHNMVAENLSAVAPSRDDPIKELLSDLGTAKGNEVDLSSASSGGEITLTLKSRFKVQEDPHAEARALFTATKRLVLFIIRVQSGSNLMEILLRPITYEDDDRWIGLVQEEMAEKESSGHGRVARKAFHQGAFDPRASFRGGRAQSVYSEAPSAFSDDAKTNNMLDIEGMTYAELKSQALENILALENHSIPPQFRVSRANNYQEILNALAADIRSKHRRRLERQRETDATQQTLGGLDRKAEYLEEQLTSYNDYIEQCLHTLANKKTGHKGFRLPFTKQWKHERELERAGRQPKFGSYKYSARQLADKGVLVAWSAYPVESWNQLNVVISSDEVGVFHLEASSGSTMLPGASANVLLDDLLQAQYDNKNAISVFDEAGKADGARLATNLLLHLVFKRFYRDE